MVSDLDNKLSDQFYRSSKELWERQTEEPPISPGRANRMPARICQFPRSRSASVVIKKNILKVGIFLEAKKRVFIHHENTTNSPQKHHKKPSQKHPFFAKPPAKTQFRALKHFFQKCPAALLQEHHLEERQKHHPGSKAIELLPSEVHGEARSEEGSEGRAAVAAPAIPMARPLYC
jgi:hypothetical protein